MALQMHFIVDYNDELFNVATDKLVDCLSYADIIGHRAPITCWYQDTITTYWIRIPRIEILRSLLKGTSTNEQHKLRFQLSDQSPNTTPMKKAPDSDDSVDDDTENIDIPDRQHVILQEALDTSSTRIIVAADSLLTSIRLDAEKGISPFSVKVQAKDQNNKPIEIQLNREIWTRCLLRGSPSAEMFIDYVVLGFESLYTLGDKLKELHGNKDLWLRLKCFHFDLKHFSDKHAQHRLENFCGEFYMSERYFSNTEVEYLLDFPTPSGATARLALQALFAAKGSIAEVCTSHDVAPAIERIYGIRKGFEKEPQFIAYFKKFANKKGTF